MSLINRIRRLLYGSARALGDVQSLSSPKKYVHRKVRKVAYRGAFSFLRKIVR